jgi:hypothetical protein
MVDTGWLIENHSPLTVYFGGLTWGTRWLFLEMIRTEWVFPMRLVIRFEMHYNGNVCVISSKIAK